MYFSVEASYQEIELNLIEQKRTESRKDNVLDPPFPSFECHEEESGPDGYSGHDTPAQIGIMAGIEPEECVRIDILHGRHHSRHQRHASEKDKYRDHVALGECLKTDVGGGRIDAARSRHMASNITAKTIAVRICSPSSQS